MIVGFFGLISTQVLELITKTSNMVVIRKPIAIIMTISTTMLPSTCNIISNNMPAVITLKFKSMVINVTANNPLLE